ncbi:LytR/AlgR family response regulator transcription factor [Hymenobacter aranciens]|uniref:LytR/AlgR family response regulator transcription factor n=1 Tax=Hymenobacter aranciens TaxID=3063996 RepID=UPI00272D3301|nr:LytTR family transcriptional regulator DNA-binding domain-containing protein [Hymenobacter sp. ASUV-10]
MEENDLQTELLQQCLTLAGLYVLGPVVTIAEAIEVCTFTPPALIIMGAKILSEAIGFSTIIEFLRCVHRTPIIVTSTVDEVGLLKKFWAIQPAAFLPKPYNIGVLLQIVKQSFPKPALDEKLYSGSAGPEQENSEIYVRDKHLLIRVPFEGILCVEAAQKYCLLRLTNGKKYSVHIPLARLLNRLKPAGFVRVHRSWLVRLRSIEYLDLSAGVIHLSDALEVPLGRFYRDDVIERLNLLD